MDTTSPFSITVTWTLHEALSPCPESTFLVQVYAEALDLHPGQAWTGSRTVCLGKVEVPCSLFDQQSTFNTIVPVPAGMPASGRFKLSALVIQMHDGIATGDHAFLEGPVIEFLAS